MKDYDSIGAIIKEFIKCRNKTIKETAHDMNIKYTTFSEQLNRNTVTADVLFKLSEYLDIDLNWMSAVLGYHTSSNGLESEMVPRMSNEFRKNEGIKVQKVLDVLILENPSSTSAVRRELLKYYRNNMFYLLDVLVPKDFEMYVISERGERKYYIEFPYVKKDECNMMVRKRINKLNEGRRVLELIIEERKEQL